MPLLNLIAGVLAVVLSVPLNLLGDLTGLFGGGHLISCVVNQGCTVTPG